MRRVRLIIGVLQIVTGLFTTILAVLALNNKMSALYVMISLAIVCFFNVLSLCVSLLGMIKNHKIEKLKNNR